MVKNKESRDIGESAERPRISSLQNVSQNHFHKIGKFKKISPRKNQNI